MVTPPSVHQDPLYQLLGTYANASYRPVSDKINEIRDSGDLSRARQFLDQARKDHPSRPDLWQRHEELLQQAHGQVLYRKLSDINRTTLTQTTRGPAPRVRYVPIESVTIGWENGTIEKVSQCIVAYITYRTAPNKPPITVSVPPEDDSLRVGEDWINERKVLNDRLEEIRKLWRITKLTPIPKPHESRRTSYVEQPDDFDKNGFKQWLMQEWSIKLVEPTPEQQAEIAKLGGKDMPHRLIKRPPPSALKSPPVSRKVSSTSLRSNAGSATSASSNASRQSSIASSYAGSRSSSISKSSESARRKSTSSTA